MDSEEEPEPRDQSPTRANRRLTDVKKMNLHKLYCSEAIEKQFYPVPQDEIHAGIPATRTTEALFDLGDRPSRRSLSPWDCFERFFSTDKGSIWAMAAQSTNANIRLLVGVSRPGQPSEIRLVFLLR